MPARSMPESLSSASQILRAIDASARAPKVVSFDVFDTLVQRTLPHPDLTKVPAAASLADDGDGLSTHDLLLQRLQIEAAQRAAKAGTGADPECRIEEVFEEWLRLNHRDADHDAVERLIRTEIGSELKVVHAAPGFHQLLDVLRDRGVRLLYLTDMYLGRRHIEEILAACGLLSLFSGGYISCEIGRGKYSSRLFEYMLEQEDLSSKDVVHVGDRLDADIHGARNHSIRAIWYQAPDRVKRHERQSAIEQLRQNNTFWEGARWSGLNIADIHHERRARGDLRYSIGYRYLGPLFCNFLHRVQRCLARDGTERVLFNSREGFLFLEIWDRLASASKNPLPQAGYSHLTRKSIYLASLRSFGRREVDMAFHTTRPTLRNMLVRFSLPVEEMEPLAKESGIADLDAAIEHPWRDKCLQRLIRDPRFLEVIAREQSAHAALLRRYLDQLGFWHSSKVAIVDVGWNGTAQEALATAFCDEPDFPELHGHYMALHGSIPFDEIPKSHMHGVYHDYRQRQDGSVFSRFTELFETACRAPHPTAIGFEATEAGAVEPRFKAFDSADHLMERRSDGLVSALQCGILDYCDDYVRTLNFHDRPPEDSSAYLLYRLDRLLRFPTRQEADLLTDFSHSEDFGQSIVHVSADAQSLLSEQEQLSGQSAGLRVLWREADLMQRGVPASNILLSLYRVFYTRRF